MQIRSLFQQKKKKKKVDFFLLSEGILVFPFFVNYRVQITF